MSERFASVGKLKVYKLDTRALQLGGASYLRLVTQAKPLMPRMLTAITTLAH